MGNEFVGSAGHSAEYFGDTREFSATGGNVVY